MRFLPLLLVSSLALAGCARVAESPLNPLNWFGSSRAVAVQSQDGTPRPLIPADRGVRIVDERPLIREIVALSVDRTPQGAIVTATGQASTQGWFNAELVPVSFDGGTLTLAFRAEPPTGFEATGTEASRRIVAARAFSRSDLFGVRAIRVAGEVNARVSSR